MSDYPHSEFVSNIKKSDDSIFGSIGISNFVQQQDFMDKLKRFSLFPSWLIHDDLFPIISTIYGVTDLVQGLNANCCATKLTVRLYIVPQSVVSLYDHTVYLHVDIPPFAQYLEKKGVLRFEGRSIDGTNFSADDIGKAIQEMYGNVRTDDAPNIIILVDRRQSKRSGEQQIVMFECANWNLFEDLRSNHLIGFDFEVSSDVVRAYLNYGMRQRTRIYPEFMVSVVPKLFVSPSDVTDHDFVKKLYSAEYKRRWNVNLDDKHFNAIYKAITGYDHETNNYFRAKNSRKVPDGRFLEFMEERFLREQRRTSVIAMESFLMKNHYDSDAVVYDVLIQGNPEDESSNTKELFQNVGRGDSDWNILRDSVLEWEQTRCGKHNVHDIADCVRMRRLICHLRRFQVVNYVINECNFKHFNLEQIIADFDHLVAVHQMFNDDNTVEIQRFIIDRIPCMCHECVVVNSFRRRGASRRQNDQYIDEQLQADNSMHSSSTECAVLTDTLNALHCYLLHRDELYRLSGDDEQMESRFSSLVIVGAGEEEQTVDEKEKEPFSIDFGVSVLQWLPYGEDSQFNSLRDQMVHNIDSTIDQETYDQMEIECIAKIKNQQFEDYTLDELVGLKFYSDWTKLCTLLRKAHWETASLSIKKRYHYWARTIYRAALRHAKPIPVQPGGLLVPSSLYHGLTLLFRMDQESPLYFGPFSTTLSRNVASTFIKEQGLRLHIKSDYGDVMKCCLGIDMRSISAFKREQEILLVDQVIPIQSTKALKTGDEASINHLLFSLKTRRSQIRDPTAFYQKLGIKFKTEWTERISQHPQLHATSGYKDNTIKHRLIHELKINEHFAPRVVVEAIQRINVDDNLNISDPSIPCNVQQFKAGDIINLKRNKEWVKSTVSRVFAEALCVRTLLNGKYVFRWLEGNALSEGIRVRFPQQNSCSQYQFTFENVHDKAAKIMRRFTDLQRFNIPFGNLVSSLPRCVECLDDALGSVQIGMAVRDDDWESVLPIQTVPIPTVFSVALISNHFKCFRISRFINMSRQNGRNGGKLSVISSSSIIIDENGGINGSDCGLQRGVLILSATKSVENDGVLLCGPSKGKIYILSVGSFVNGGRISCEKDGTICISCRKFVNRGVITTVPFIKINDGQSVGFSFKALEAELKEKRVKLSVAAHRGDSFGGIPQHLLQPEFAAFYCSISDWSGSGLHSSERGPPNEDWIVFRMNTVRPMFINGIGIRNGNIGAAIKRISIEGSVDGKAFEHWIQINDIQRKNGLQRFDVDIGPSHCAVANEWKFYKMRILENYGYESNQFYEFVMFGVGE